MEQHFYRDEFEQMLKDTTEDFRMYPSRKIWHSIYNDLHPDRKWPSFAVCLLLLVSILYVGVSNNNNLSKNARSMIAATNATPAPELSQPTESRSHLSAVTSSKSNRTGITNNRTFVTGPLTLAANGLQTSTLENRTATTVTTTPTTHDSFVANDYTNQLVAAEPGILAKELQLPPLNSLIIEGSKALDFKSTAKNIDTDNGNNLATISGQNQAPSISGLSNKTSAKMKTGYKANYDLATLSWMEDFAFHNTANKKKWKTNTSFQYYVTPSLGYRTLEKNNDFEPTTGALLRTSDNEAVTQQAAPGFEAGVQLLVGLSKKIRFKVGLQYNYTNYITYAHELQHPSQATVSMNDMNNRFVIPVSYTSNHANVLGSNFDRLNNTTNQISIPLGLDYKLAGTQKVRWYVASSIQPSYVISGKAFLISHDSKNFVEDASQLRKFNLNTSLETFVSFKTPSGIDINVGPQVRYQLLSTYQREYTYTEKLYNLGLKIGLTKKL